MTDREIGAAERLATAPAAVDMPLLRDAVIRFGEAAETEIARLTADLAAAVRERDEAQAELDRLRAERAPAEAAAPAPSIYEHTQHDWVQCVCPQCQQIATCMDYRARLTAERDEAARLSHQYRNERDTAVRERDAALRERDGARGAVRVLSAWTREHTEATRLTGEVERLRAHVRTLGALADLTPEQLGRLLAIEPTPEQVARLVEGA